MLTMTVRSNDTERTDDTPQPFRITARVLAILAAVGRFGVLTSEQIARFDGVSGRLVLREYTEKDAEEDEKKGSKFAKKK